MEKLSELATGFNRMYQEYRPQVNAVGLILLFGLVWYDYLQAMMLNSAVVLYMGHATLELLNQFKKETTDALPKATTLLEKWGAYVAVLGLDKLVSLVYWVPFVGQVLGPVLAVYPFLKLGFFLWILSDVNHVSEFYHNWVSPYYTKYNDEVTWAMGWANFAGQYASKRSKDLLEVPTLVTANEKVRTWVNKLSFGHLLQKANEMRETFEAENKTPAVDGSNKPKTQ